MEVGFLKDVDLPFCGGNIFVLGVVWIFNLYEKALRPEEKKRLGEGLAEFDLNAFFRRLAAYLGQVLDRIFGKDHFTLKCFRRSILASAISVILLHIIYFFFFRIEWEKTTWADWLYFLVNLIANFLLFNALLDFFTLWKTKVSRLPAGKGLRQEDNLDNYPRYYYHIIHRLRKVHHNNVNTFWT